MRSIVISALALGAAACSSSPVDAPSPPASPRAWQRLAPPTSALPATRGLRPTRGIIHSHSPYSHDACDGAGLTASGSPDPACAAELRLGICEAAEDFVMLTDHAAHMAAAPFEDLLFITPADEPVVGAGGTVVANRLACGDGRSALVMAGNEDRLMSLGLEAHLPGSALEREALYDGDSAATADAMHAAGGLVAVPHTESRTAEYLLGMPFDAIEIYNLHAALDPDIRRDYFGLDAYAAAVSILPFTKLEEDAPQPDLTLLGFYEDLPVYLAAWDALLPVRHVTGIAGTDVHQNTFPSQMRDGERGDSYRRLMRWISNVVLLDGEPTPTSVKAALRDGRGYVAFEILGTPSGFDLHAVLGQEVFEMGSDVPAGAALVARAPVLHDPDPAVTPPDISMRLLRITADGTTVAGEGSSIDLASAAPGVYRAEVRITPHHLRPYLGLTPDGYIRDFLWVVSNPIYVE